MKKIALIILPLLVFVAAPVFAQTGSESAPPPAVADSVPAAAAPQPEQPSEPPTAAEASPSYRLAVNFEENSLELTPLSFAALDSMSVLFVLHSSNRYEVHGYSCPNTGGQKVIRLSLQRVERVVEHLAALGIPGENILTVINAPKSAAGAKPCTDDRQVDIISSGMRWRIEESQPAPKPGPDTDVLDGLKAEMMDLKRKLAESESAAPEAPTSAPAAAEEGKQAVAVYMAGQEPAGAKGVHTIMGGELARVLSESEKYTAVDRTAAILEQLDREQAYQRSGAVDDDQIKAIGHQLGVQYLCISNINPVGNRYYLDTRLVDVVTAEIARSVTATSRLRDAAEMSAIGRNIALELLEAERTRRQRALRKKMFRYTAIGLDVVGVGVLAYACLENSNMIKFNKIFRQGPPPDAPDIPSLGHIDNGPESVRAEKRRNAAFIVGGILAASGVTIHILF